MYILAAYHISAIIGSFFVDVCVEKICCNLLQQCFSLALDKK